MAAQEMQRKLYAEELGKIGYQFLEVVEKGSFGVIHKAIKENTGELVAVKQIRLGGEEGITTRVLREVGLLQMLKDGPRIIRLLETNKTFSRRGVPVYNLTFEYMEMSLKKYIAENEVLSPEIVKLLMYQLCDGVSFIHSHAAMHRDLKPENLLVNSSPLELKIADFGFGRQYSIPIEEYSLDVMSQSYKAPEVLALIQEYTVAADMWSVGCIFGELINTRVLFKKKGTESQLESIFRVLGTPNEKDLPSINNYLEHGSNLGDAQDLSLVFPSLTACGLDLLSKMLHYDQSKRISAKEAMEHPYFKSPDT